LILFYCMVNFFSLPLKYTFFYGPFQIVEECCPPPKQKCLFKFPSFKIGQIKCWLFAAHKCLLQFLYLICPKLVIVKFYSLRWYLGWIVLLSLLSLQLLKRLKWFISRLDLILVPTLKVFCSKKGSLKDRWRVDACCLSHPQFVLETMGTLNEHLEGTNSFVNLVGVHISMRRSRLTRNFVLKLDICEEETEKNLQFHFFKTR